MSTDEPSRYRWIVMSLVFAAGFISIGWIWFSLPVLLPQIGDELDLAAWQTQLIFGAIPMSFIVTALTGGMVGDRYSLKWVVGGGIALMGIGGLLRAGLPGYAGALVASLTTGLGLGLTVPNYVNALRRWFPPGELGIANGLRLAGVRSGAAVAQGVVVGLLLAWLGGWRPTQAVLGGAGIATAGLWILVYRESGGTSDQSTEVRARYAETLRTLLGRRELLVLGSLTFLHLFSFMAYLGLLPTWLHRMENVTAARVGPYSSVVFWCGIVGGIGLPSLSDWLGRRKAVILPSLFLMLTGIVGTGLVGGGWMLLGSIALTGIGGGSMLPLLLTVVSEHSDSGSAGGPAGMLLSCGQVGATLGPPLGGAVLEWGGVTPSATMLGLPLVVGTVMLYWVQETGPGVE